MFKNFFGMTSFYISQCIENCCIVLLRLFFKPRIYFSFFFSMKVGRVAFVTQVKEPNFVYESLNLFTMLNYNPNSLYQEYVNM